uniref:Uncharacterized protein n=1 Tax=Angiostrongylus cantonensis TaxID=6313 RepID=A0A0K0DMS4_ANGCA
MGSTINVGSPGEAARTDTGGGARRVTPWEQEGAGWSGGERQEWPLDGPWTGSPVRNWDCTLLGLDSTTRE